MIRQFKSRLKSFQFAVSGIVYVLKTQVNMWLHCLIGVCVLITGWQLNISNEDWRWLLICMTLVLAAEVINTAFEFVCNVVSPDFNEDVKKTKNIAAGAVLICAIGAAAIGSNVLLPYVK